MSNRRGTALNRSGDGPHPVDVHVGNRIRQRRKRAGLSQQALAATIGVTFQQLQKYEHGTNRVSASRLFDIAKALNVDVGYFFAGCDDSEDFVQTADESFLGVPEGAALAKAFPRIRSDMLRRRVLDLVRALTEDAPIPE